jgi:hypothetical protein
MHDGCFVIVIIVRDARPRRQSSQYIGYITNNEYTMHDHDVLSAVFVCVLPANNNGSSSNNNRCRHLANNRETANDLPPT